MDRDFLETMLLTFKLATTTTVILLAIGLPIAVYLAHSKKWYKSILETIVSMPLVLPPSVLGFYLLLAFSPSSFIGSTLHNLGIDLTFSFTGLVVGSVIFSLPFMVHPVTSALANVPKNLYEASYTMGKSKIETLRKIILPIIKPSILSGIVLSFAHTIGEFGVVLMIGGNLQGETRVASIAIYDEVESLNYAVAQQYAFVLFALSFSILLIVYHLNKRYLSGFVR